MALKGSVTHISFDEIYGWTRFSNTPYQSPLVQAFIDGVVIAEARADLFHAPFAFLGSDAACCGFMLDLSNAAVSHADRVSLLVDGEVLPGAPLHLPRRPSDQEVFVGSGGIAHVFAYRVGQYDISSEQPLSTVWVYSKSRHLGSDRRRLGGMIGDVFANGVAVDMSTSLSFAEGFHNPEKNSRWTDGKAKLQFQVDEQPHSLSFKVFVLAAGQL